MKETIELLEQQMKETERQSFVIQHNGSKKFYNANFNLWVENPFLAYSHASMVRVTLMVFDKNLSGVSVVPFPKAGQ